LIEVGLLSGDPLAAEDWTSDQRVAALAWWRARTNGTPSAWAVGIGDLRIVVRQTIEAFPRLLGWLRG
jgi:hypothetical protein